MIRNSAMDRPRFRQRLEVVTFEVISGLFPFGHHLSQQPRFLLLPLFLFVLFFKLFLSGFLGSAFHVLFETFARLPHSFHFGRNFFGSLLSGRFGLGCSRCAAARRLITLDPAVKCSLVKKHVKTTVGARIPNARKPNPFENRTFFCSVFEWSTIRKPNIRKPNFKMAALA